MITNMTDQRTSIRFASPPPNTWLAIEKYANVRRPVDAIPIERMRAPLA
jgi:hypothetical protein